MSDGTKIEWTDATWNVINGCSVVSPGCTNCYAMRLAGTRFRDHPTREGLTVDSKAGPVWNGRVRFNEKVADQPLRWRRPRMIFVCAHGDLFHENVPDEWIDRVFAVMALAPQHVFQVLTKRPERMRDYLTAERRRAGWFEALSDLAQARALPPLVSTFPLPNVWLGVSAEDQQRADERVPILLHTPAAVRWISAEPLLGPVDLTAIPYAPPEDEIIPTINALEVQPLLSAYGIGGEKVDWVVAGGESGPGARPMDEAWARSLRDQCAAAGVAFFCKQLSIPGGTKALKDIEQFPPDLRVREYPRAA